VTGILLLDNSAWTRLGGPAVRDQRREEIADAMRAGQIAVSLPLLLEAGYSARDASDHGQLIDELLSLPLLSIDEQVERRALDAQRQLARVGHHRLPPVDVLTAALADHHDVGILHYDNDYDLIAAKTDLRIQSTWLAPRGTL
jgi:predicted nucleic acid-binding protein